MKVKYNKAYNIIKKVVIFNLFCFGDIVSILYNDSTNKSVMAENKMTKAGAAIGAPLSLNAQQKKFEFSEKRAFSSR